MPRSDETKRLFPVWFYVVNTGLLVAAFGFLLAYLITATLLVPPYDYQYVRDGTHLFCDNPSEFAYNDLWLYPAPLYSTLCLPVEHLAFPLMWFWMLAPFFLVIIIAGRRGVVFGYPPLFLLLQLGQTTWLTLPIYWMAEKQPDDRRVRWWYGLIFALGVFKPHIALLAILWLAYQWRKQRNVLLTGLIAVVALAIPAFLMRPTWLMEWLGNGRGYRPQSIANIGIIPVQFFGLDLENVGGRFQQLSVWGFCGLVALLLIILIKQRRGKLEFYDWVLIFCLANPLIHDYDLVILLPMIANRPQRLLLALITGIVTWCYVMMSGVVLDNGGYYHSVLLITVVLLVQRLYHVDDRVISKIGPVIRW